MAQGKFLVAGAGGLLGSTLTHALLLNGARVVAADIGQDAMCNRLEALGVALDDPLLELAELDVTRPESLKPFLADCPGLSGAVNATYPRGKGYGAHFYDVELSSFNENLSLHLGSAFLFMQQCAEYFRRNQAPFSLVNISSIYGVIAPRFSVYQDTPMTMPVEYAAIKSAIIHLGKYAAAYVHDSRFRVNCVSPGGLLDRQPERFLQAYKDLSLGTGMLRASDMTGSILFLLGEESRFVNGQNIVVDDGFSL